MSITKTDVVQNTLNDIYCRIRRSKTHGVGVHAIRDIPKGTNPFKLPRNKFIQYHTVAVKQEELKGVNPEVKSMLEDFLGGDSAYHIPHFGLNSLDISFFMNHSKANNIGIKGSYKSDYYIFVALRDIKKGEELTINYDDYG